MHERAVLKVVIGRHDPHIFVLLDNGEINQVTVRWDFDVQPFTPLTILSLDGMLGPCHRASCACKPQQHYSFIHTDLETLFLQVCDDGAHSTKRLLEDPTVLKDFLMQVIIRIQIKSCNGNATSNKIPHHGPRNTCPD